MTRKRVKLSWVVNETSRAISLKKKRLGLVKKVRELTILCDVRACIVMFSPNEVGSMVWPSLETARDLLDDFFALPEMEKKKKETTLESYLMENIRKVLEQIKKRQKKNMESMIDQLMSKLKHGGENSDLNMSEINQLLSFSRDKIMLCRKRLDFVHHPPLRDPPMNPVEARTDPEHKRVLRRTSKNLEPTLFEAQPEERRTTMNGVFVEFGQDYERAKKIDETTKRIRTGNAIWGNQSHYLMDQWLFPPSEPPKPTIHQQIRMGMGPYNENLNHRSYLTYQGSSSNGNHNMEMEPVGSQMITFNGLARSISQPLHHHNMENNPIMPMSQLNKYPFNFMTCDLELKEDRNNISNGDLQFHRSINTMTTNNGVNQEPSPPPNGTTTEQNNVQLTSLDISSVWPGTTNHHF